MSGEGPVSVEVRERVRVLRLDHGANALDEELVGALEEHLERLAAAGAPALVLASSHPKVFCPGLDLKKLNGQARAPLRAAMVRYNALLRRLATYPGPTVAALTGHAVAGGCLLALACDRRVMARAQARIGLSEINLGIPVPAGAVRMLLALFPTRAVEQLVLEGDGFGGERALELGLVERLADPASVVDDACHLANHLASRPPTAFSSAKRFLRHGLEAAMRERDEAELECFLDHWFDEATQDRMAALVATMSR
ncbi:MAG: enoyl-CoA hydratase/isomerase family protein [Acidobacteriota bacterium]